MQVIDRFVAQRQIKRIHVAVISLLILFDPTPELHTSSLMRKEL